MLLESSLDCYDMLALKINTAKFNDKIKRISTMYSR
jgi:hypothetical protein